MTLAMLHWIWTQLLLSRPLLVTEYQVIIKSIRHIQPVLIKLTFCVSAPSACTIIFLKMPSIPFYLQRWSPAYFHIREGGLKTCKSIKISKSISFTITILSHTHYTYEKVKWVKIKRPLVCSYHNNILSLF
jgi:hypothetical protein